MGEGDLPIGRDDARPSRSINYDGFICLEWDPQWMLRDLQDMEVIFSHFVNYMATVRHPSRAKQSFLYDNARRDGGKYVWKKDDLSGLDLLRRFWTGWWRSFQISTAFKYTTLDYTRTYSEFRDDVDTVLPEPCWPWAYGRGSHVAVWCHQHSPVVHHLLGHDQDRRRAGHDEHRLQDPRGGISAAPVRHPHPGDDRRLAGLQLRRDHQRALPGASGPPRPASPCTAAACRSCATSSPWASASRAA